MTQFDLIRAWASEKGIDTVDRIDKQALKLFEEAGELAQALAKPGRDAELRDAIGDCVVVLTIMAQQKGWKIEDCISEVYDIISKRKGTTVNGVFVKEEDVK